MFGGVIDTVAFSLELEILYNQVLKSLKMPCTKAILTRLATGMGLVGCDQNAPSDHYLVHSTDVQFDTSIFTYSYRVDPIKVDNLI